MKNHSINAFTLAEVLIVLGIIGVIASLTIPGLVQDIQDAQLKTAWKKAYGMLDQASRRVMLDNGGNFKGLSDDSNGLRDKYLPYLAYTKSCNDGLAFGNCWVNLTDWKWMNNNINLSWGNTASIILNNGSFIRFNMNSKPCTASIGSLQRCAYLAIDLNGFKGPNTVGKDMFFAHIFENSIKPFGISGDGFINTCTKTSLGYSCSTEYLYK